MRAWAVILVMAAFAALCAQAARAQGDGGPDVLILGDSQLSFGAGQAFVTLFDRLRGDCGLAPDTTVGVIGVRSSSLQSWTGRGKTAKAAICDVDPTWKVNAGAFGTLSPADTIYVQIGQGRQFQFCTPDRSPLQAVFHNGYYRPKLVVMFLMGNAADRWAGSAEAALQDVTSFVADLPPGQPCIFMTSAPPHGEKTVRLRQRAQDNIAAAFARAGGQCRFVPGFTPDTIRENMGNAANFRRHANGRVKDPFHPTEAAANRFLALQRGAICAAVAAAMAP